MIKFAYFLQTKVGNSELKTSAWLRSADQRQHKICSESKFVNNTNFPTKIFLSFKKNPSKELDTNGSDLGRS